jgi:hypothetical protein
VRHDWEEANARKPLGYEPIVTVFLDGEPDGIDLGFVETRPDHDETWTRFESRAGDHDADVIEGSAIPWNVFWTHVPESKIARIEVRYRRAHALDFRYADAGPDDPPPMIPA